MNKLFLGKLSENMEIIEKTSDLVSACNTLTKSDYITIDTEFVREKTFWPDLCLVQMANDDFECLVDPLASGLDLASFWALMTNRDVLKVFHSGRQDIEIIHKMSGGLLPEPVFDTQIAAMVCGFGESVSYAGLVESQHKIILDKGQRFTDWSRRPLSKKQQTYAINDVTYLRDIYKDLKSRLESTGRSSWLDEEMKILCSAGTYEQHPDEAWKRLKMRHRKPESIAVMMELAKWREEKAQGQNVPRNRIIKDDAIYDISGQLPRNPKELERLRTIGKHVANGKKGHEILSVVRAGLKRDFSSLPKAKAGKKPSPKVLAITELLKVLLKSVAAEQGVAPKVIANAADLEKIAQDDDADVQALQGWRMELFGKEALRLKHGKTAMTISDGQIVCVSLEAAE